LSRPFLKFFQKISECRGWEMHPFSNQSTLLTTQVLCSRPLDLVKSFSGGLPRNFPRPLYIYIIALLEVFVKGFLKNFSKNFFSSGLLGDC
jgi:hypothetical protein